jgi:hypothetical protein
MNLVSNLRPHTGHARKKVITLDTGFAAATMKVLLLRNVTKEPISHGYFGYP